MGEELNSIFQSIKSCVNFGSVVGGHDYRSKIFLPKRPKGWAFHPKIKVMPAFVCEYFGFAFVQKIYLGSCKVSQDIFKSVQVFALGNASDLRLYTTLNILDIAGIGGGINKQLNCRAHCRVCETNGAPLLVYR